MTCGDWLDCFFKSYYLHRPVNATFIGVHDHDRDLPDLSENGAGDTLAEMRTLLSHAKELEPPANRHQRIDLELAQGFLRLQVWEYESRHFHGGNPSF